MKLTSPLRTPYRSRTVVRADVTKAMDEAGLGRAVALTRFVLLVLCAARVGSDWLRGAPSIEGRMALVLVVVLVMSLVANAVGDSG